MEYSVIGKRLPRVDGVVKATGEAKYAADLSLPGMLWGKILRSPFPHARILNIDTRRAKRLPGVKAIITGKDFGGFTYGFMPSTREQVALADEKVRYVGEGVAAVAAIDEDLAQEALELIKVDYEELPAVFDAEDALQEGAPLVNEHAKGNIGFTSRMDVGDVERGFRESDYVREDRFRTARQIHGFIEPHAALAKYDSSDKVTIWASKMTPYFPHRVLALAFGLPLNKVRLIQPYIGSGFGAKNDAFDLDLCAVLLSKMTGKPVKIVYSQKEVLAVGRRRRSKIIVLKTGVKKDGTLVARQCWAIAEAGACATIGPLSMYLTGALLTLPYKIPNVKYEGHLVYTNTPPGNAQRAHGFGHSHFGGELQLDMIAEELGIDPVEIRLKNAVEAGYVTPNGIHVTSCALKECIQKAAQNANWKERYGKKEERGAVSRGMGFTCAAYISGARLRGHAACAANIRVQEDGSISLITGATDCGQGSDTVLSQIAAEELGVALEDVQISMVDTDLTPLDPGTYSSRVTFVAGNAVKLAAADAKRQLAEVAAQALGADIQDIVFKDRRVFVKGNPEKGMPFGRLARMASYGGGGKVIMGKGYASPELDPPDLENCMGDITRAWSFSAQVAEVEVDRETGQVRFVDTTVAHDCGVALNPMAVEGQTDGCVSMGQGQTMSEEFIIEKGRTLNTSFSDYKMPRSLDAPRVKSSLVETVDPLGPFGAKEASEVVLVSTYPAIVNAIHNATGVWIKELPTTSEKVLKALKEKGA